MAVATPHPGVPVATPSALRPASLAKNRGLQDPQTTKPPDQANEAHEKDLEHDRKEGERYVRDVEKELIVINDPVQQARVDRIGHELSEIANHNRVIALWGDKRLNPFDYDFHIVLSKDPREADMVNAFSIPGGHIFIFQATLKFCESDDELAGIIAHEIAHAAFRHVAILESREKNLSTLQIPLILAGILTGGGALAIPAIMGTSLAGTATMSGFSVKAEQAADYGGFQFLLHSRYDPTGMLTTMERLALLERDNPLGFELGILRDHPPSRARADSLIHYMNLAGVPIKRSHVAASFRAEPKMESGGRVDICFGRMPLVTLSGKDALSRADLASQRLNEFFDAVPDAYEVQSENGGMIVNGRRPLIELNAEDAAAAHLPLDELQQKAITRIRAALMSIGSRVWDVR